MKHVEEFITERRNLRDYKKYHEIIKDKYYHNIINNIEKVALYEEDGMIYLEMIIWNAIYDGYINIYKKEMGDIRYSIYSQNGSQVRLVIQGISKEFLENLELEYSAKKYNL
jgi:hypothetical protein